MLLLHKGRTGAQNHDYDLCSWRFNRAVAKEAHRHGFNVLEREEIERRYLFKGMYMHQI